MSFSQHLDDKHTYKQGYNKFLTYLELAQSYTREQEPALIITRGLSASGKSTVSQSLVERLGAIRIRSDVERKRMFDIKIEGESGADIEQGIYTPEATKKTYIRLAELAGYIIEAGFSVIVDATCLQYEQRECFQNLAAEKRIPYVILDFIAPDELLRQRIRQRKHDVSDADLSVLEHQLIHYSPLHEEEKSNAIVVDTAQGPDIDSLADRILNTRNRELLPA